MTVTPDSDRFKEHNPDYRALTIKTLEKRIEDERQARVNALFSLDEQVQLLTAAVAHLVGSKLSSDEARLIETGASDLRRFLACVTQHRLAANLIIKTVNAAGADLKAIDPKAKHWWPDYDNRN